MSTRRGRVAAGLLLFVAGVLSPFTYAWASHRFEDVPEGTHHDNISAIADAGITLGCTDPQHYCPGDFVTRAQMGSFLARLGGLSNDNTTNLPVANGRSPIQVYCTLAARHPATLDPSPCVTKSEFLANLNVIEEAPVVIGSGGIPYVAYYESADDDLRIARCWSHECAGLTYFSVDTSGDTGQRPAMTVDRDGLPYVAYYDFVTPNYRLKLAHCTTPACATATVQVLDGAAPRDPISIELGPNGYPLVAYTDGGVQLIRCGNASCSSATTKTIDAATPALAPNLKIGADGIPVIAYHDTFFNDLMFARCSDTTCEATATVSRLEQANDVGYLPSMAIGFDGNPVIAHFDDTNNDLRLARCQDPQCSAIDARTIDDGGADAGYRSSIVIGLDGRPVFTFYDNGNTTLRLSRCANRACTSDVNTVLDSTPNTGLFSSVAIGVDGVPVIAYRRANTELRVARPAI